MRSFIIFFLVSSIISVQTLKVKSFIDFLRQKTDVSTTISTTTQTISHITASSTNGYNKINLLEDCLIAFVSALATGISGYGCLCICKCIKKRQRTKCMQKIEHSHQQHDQNETQNELMGLYVVNNAAHIEEFQI